MMKRVTFLRPNPCTRIISTVSSCKWSVLVHSEKLNEGRDARCSLPLVWVPCKRSKKKKMHNPANRKEQSASFFMFWGFFLGTSSLSAGLEDGRQWISILSVQHTLQSWSLNRHKWQNLQWWKQRRATEMERRWHAVSDFTPGHHRASRAGDACLFLQLQASGRFCKCLTTLWKGLPQREAFI